MLNVEPFEVVAQPLEVWLAPVGTAFPDVDVEPSGPWVKVGSNGTLNYDEKGVSVSHKDKTEGFRPVGSTGVMKMFRVEEEMSISIVLVDTTLEQYAIALNHNSVTTTPAGVGTPGTKKIGLTRGGNVATRALLARGMSAYGNWPAQYEIPIAAQVGAPKPSYEKGKPAALELEWTAMVDPNATSDDERFGRLVMQHEEAGT